MTTAPLRHPLDVALDAARTAGGLYDWLALLAALGASDRSVDAKPEIAWAQAWLREDDLPADELGAYLEALVPEPPDEPLELDGWIFGAEMLGLAASVCERFAAPAAAAVILARVAELRSTATRWAARDWDCRLVGTQSREGLPAVFPWTEIRSRRAQGRLQPSVVDPRAVEAWLVDTLHAEDAQTLVSWIPSDSQWRAEYRRVVGWLADEIVVPARDEVESIGSARDPAELAWADLLLSVPVPHRGVGVRFEVRRAAGGVYSAFTDDGRASFTPDTEGGVTWGDDVLGELRSPLRLLPAATREILQDVHDSTLRLAEGVPHPRRLPIALAVAAGLQAGLAYRSLAEAARVFMTGEDGSGHEPSCAAAVLGTRVALERLGDRLEHHERAALDDALDRADDALLPHADGLLLLDNEVYLDFLDGEVPPPGLWWGRPAQVDARVPELLLGSVLERATRPSTAAEEGTWP